MTSLLVSYIEDFRYNCDYFRSLFVLNASYTHTVAANILSRKNHKIGDSPLKVKQLVKDETSGVQYEQDKIRITSTIPQHLLLLCVETQFDMDEKDFTLKMITDESYILVFNSARTIKGIFVLMVLCTLNQYVSDFCGLYLICLFILELREMCEKLGCIKIEQATLTAELVKISSRVFVQNIEAHFENVQILKMYFESSKFGGSDVDVCLVGNGMAIITFTDPKGKQGGKGRRRGYPP